jgi:microcystin-dependent protein
MTFRLIRLTRSRLSLALLGCATAATVLSTDARACAAEPYVSAVCIMAVPWTNLNGYLPADGRQLPVSSQQVLFSLIGFTYGGNNTSLFNLPDLRGRVVVGAGQGPGLPVFRVAQQGGAVSVMLNASQVPLITHTHQVNTITVTTGTGTLAATTTLTGLSATTSMSGVTATAAGSGLALNATSATASTGTPNGNALASAGLTKVYTSGTPGVAMAAGSIGGSAPVSFSGNPTTTISGTPTTTLTGAPTVVLSGSTGPAGVAPSQPVATMMPYLAMNYFIATTGIYPSRD